MSGSGMSLSDELSLALAPPAERPGQRLAGAGDLSRMHLSPAPTGTDHEAATLPEVAEPSTAGSVFASLMSGRGLQRPPVTTTSRTTTASLTRTAPPSAPTPATVAEVPLSEIGFGPGMLLRLSHLGLRTTADLARSNPRQLRADLGDSSRFVDVEAWIRRASEWARRA